MNNYDKAESYIKDALTIYENNPSIIRTSYISNLLALARIKSHQNEEIEAEEIYKKALKLARQIKFDNQTTLLTSLNSFSTFYINKYEPAKALSYLEEALKISNFKGEITPNIYDYPYNVVTLSLLINRASALTMLSFINDRDTNDSLESSTLALNFMERFRRNISDKESRLDLWERTYEFSELSLSLSNFTKEKQGKLQHHTFKFFESALSRNLSEELSTRYIQTSKEIPSDVLEQENGFFQKKRNNTNKTNKKPT